MFQLNDVKKSDFYLWSLLSNDPFYYTLKTQNHTTVNKPYDHIWLKSLPNIVASINECTFGL